MPLVQGAPPAMLTVNVKRVASSSQSVGQRPAVRSRHRAGERQAEAGAGGLVAEGRPRRAPRARGRHPRSVVDHRTLASPLYMPHVHVGPRAPAAEASTRARCGGGCRWRARSRRGRRAPVPCRRLRGRRPSPGPTARAARSDGRRAPRGPPRPAAPDAGRRPPGAEIMTRRVQAGDLGGNVDFEVARPRPRG